MFLVQVQSFGTGTRYGRNILHHCSKRIKTNSQKVFGANFYVCRSSTLLCKEVLNKTLNAIKFWEVYSDFLEKIL